MENVDEDPRVSNSKVRSDNRNLISRKCRIGVTRKFQKTTYQRNISLKFLSLKDENRRLKIRLQCLDQRAQILYRQNLMLKRTIRILNETNEILNRQTEIMNRNTELLESIVRFMDNQRIRAG